MFAETFLSAEEGLHLVFYSTQKSFRTSLIGIVTKADLVP